MFDCVALQPIRELNLGLFGPAIVTMQQFMWQAWDNLVGVARFVFDCFASLQTVSGGQWDLSYQAMSLTLSCVAGRHTAELTDYCSVRGTAYSRPAHRLGAIF